MRSPKIIGIALFLVLIIPLSVMAASVYNHNDVRADYAPTLSSLALLDPAQTPDQVLAVGGGELGVVDGIMLRSQTSPFGESDGMVWVDNGGQVAKYLVRPGDTVGYIADMYNVSAATILLQNDLKSDSHIIAGDILEILPVTGVQHTIAADETVEGIARQYDVNREDIIAFNNIDETDLNTGSHIIVPDADIVRSNSAKSKSDTPRPSDKNDTETRIVTADGYDLGDYIFPCDCIVTQGYGNSKFARTSGYYRANFHGGVDFSNSRGTGAPIVAIASGTVIHVDNSGYNGGYGLNVKIRHNDGTESLYGHNSNNIVSVGQRVEQGQIIAYMGTTGRVTGPHVHLEVSDPNNPFYTTFDGAKGF